MSTAAAARLQVIRSNETMSKAAALEQRILRLLADKDPDNRKHCIRLLRTFEYRQHVCMVFEPLVSVHVFTAGCWLYITCLSVGRFHVCTVFQRSMVDQCEYRQHVCMVFEPLVSTPVFL
jgi:hypothetical protein